MSNSMTWDGEDLSAWGLQVEAPTVPIMADIPFYSHEAIAGDSLFTSTNHTTRSISLNCSVTGHSRENLRDNMEYITRVLDPINGDKAFTLDYDVMRRYVGRVSGMSSPSVIGFWGFVFTISLECMAHKQGTAEVNGSVALASSPDTVSTAVIEGTAPRTPAEIYIRNETGGDLTNATLTIANDTTSESIVWTGTLEDDRWLRVGSLDTLGRFTASIDKSDSTGADPEAENYTSVASGYTSGDWPRLKGGVVNSLTITGISTGTLETTYRPRYHH